MELMFLLFGYCEKIVAGGYFFGFWVFWGDLGELGLEHRIPVYGTQFYAPSTELWCFKTLWIVKKLWQGGIFSVFLCFLGSLGGYRCGTQFRFTAHNSLHPAQKICVFKTCGFCKKFGRGGFFL